MGYGPLTRCEVPGYRRSVGRLPRADTRQEHWMDGGPVGTISDATESQSTYAS